MKAVEYRPWISWAEGAGRGLLWVVLCEVDACGHGQPVMPEMSESPTHACHGGETGTLGRPQLGHGKRGGGGKTYHAIFWWENLLWTARSKTTSGALQSVVDLVGPHLL